MRILIFLLALTAGSTPVRAQLLDNFSDGDFTQNPYWFGDTAQFDVLNNELHLNALSQTDTSFLSTPIQAPDSALWEMTFRLEFNPSSSNYLRWFLLSDEPNLNAAQNAYFLQIGGASNDRISLRKRGFGNTTTLWESSDDFVDSDPVAFSLSVEYSNGNWSIFKWSGTLWNPVGTASDSLSRPYMNTGIWCRYTATRSDKFYFDDFYYYFEPWVDNQDPFVTHHSIPNSNQLNLTFNEEVFADNIRLKKWGTPNWFDAHPNQESGISFTLALDQTLQSGALYQIELAEWSDLSGRTLDTTWNLGFYRPRYRDLIFTEIMPDPNPPVELPDREFIELYNRSAHEIDLGKLVLSVNDKEYPLPQIGLSADSFLVLYDAPALTNTSGSLRLTDGSGRLIDAVTYSIGQHTSRHKEEGGWSLTLNDTSRSCYGKTAWASSIHPQGGTPGKMGNLETITQPQNRWMHYSGDSLIYFVHWYHALDSVYWYVNQAEPVNKSVDVERILASPFNREQWRFSEPIPEEGIAFYWPHGLRDCRQKHFWPDTLLIMPPSEADTSDWRINEIMFEPNDEEPEWIEIVNRSNKALDLSGLYIGVYNPTFQIFESLKRLLDGSRMVLPNELVVLANQEEPLWNAYLDIDSFQVVAADDWLTLLNDSMHVAFTTVGLEILETFSYHEEMHFPYLNDTKGVSLERRSIESNANKSTSWHSGSIGSGGASPTRVNSHSSAINNDQIAVSIPTIFTPNGDGLNDLVRLKWTSDEPGEWARVHIVDFTGRPVYELSSGANLPNQTEWIWSGASSNGALCAPGIYWWWVEVQDDRGILSVQRIPFVLSF